MGRLLDTGADGAVASRRAASGGSLSCLLDGYTRICAWLAKVCRILSVIGMVALLAAVIFQVFGRHVLNDTPTWAESLSLLLVLYVTMMGAAVGVRDGTHIGFESVMLLVPEDRRCPLLLLVHALVLTFGVLMAWNCGVLAESVHTYLIPNLGLSEGLKYVPALIAGILIAIFSVEHMIAVLRNKKVESSWL